MTGAEIIAHAKQAQKRRAGVRVKVRVPSELWHNVRRCADDCKCSAEEYVYSACFGYVSGRLRVPININTQMGTREESETVWIRVPEGFDTSAESLRPVLGAAVVFTLTRISLPPIIPIEGLDYLIDGKTYTRITPRGIA